MDGGGAHGELQEGGRSGNPTFLAGFGSGIPVARLRRLLKADLLCWGTTFFTRVSLMQIGLQRAPQVQKKDDALLGIIRSAFERKTGFEPAALSRPDDAQQASSFFVL